MTRPVPARSTEASLRAAGSLHRQHMESAGDHREAHGSQFFAKKNQFGRDTHTAFFKALDQYHVPNWTCVSLYLVPYLENVCCTVRFCPKLTVLG